MAQAAPLAVSTVEPGYSSRVKFITGNDLMSLSKVLDPRWWRANVKDHWAGYLRSHYRNAEQVAAEFGVRYQTAVNWWNGDNAPSAFAVGYAGRQFTEYVERHS